MISLKKPAIIYSEVPDLPLRHIDDSALSTALAIKEAILPLKANIYALPCPCSKKHIMEMIGFFIENQTDFVFNFCEELNGNSYHEGSIAALLELLKIPFSGNWAETLFFCRDKKKVSELLNGLNIKVPASYIASNDIDLKTITCAKILKPLSEDGSFGLSRKSVVCSLEELKKSFHNLKEIIEGDVLVEDYIEGREINVTLLAGKVIGFSEVVFDYENKKHPNILTYEAKWKTESDSYKSSRVACKAELSRGLKESLKNISEKIFKVLNMRHYARVDFRLSEDGDPYVIDVNPNPCIAPDSGFMNRMKFNGEGYKKIIEVFTSI